jgi:ribonuclease-3
LFVKLIYQIKSVFLFREKYLDDKSLRRTFKNNLIALQTDLGIKIRNHGYYIKALTHRSYLELHPELNKSNERLEFLGDSVLNMIVGKYLFEHFQNESEGFLTKTRASLVNHESLSIAGEEINLQKYLFYNEKYLRGSYDGLQTILADGLEALIGAIFLDMGLNDAEKFVITHIIKPSEENDTFLIDTNYKGQLLEIAHAQKLPLPRYELIKEEGPDHKKEFTIEVYLGTDSMGLGLGKSKKSAEQEASRIALEKLKNC